MRVAEYLRQYGPSTLAELRRALPGCDMEVRRMRMSGEIFVVYGLHAIVDEEGLLKPDPVLTVVRGTSYFVGNVLITGTDSDGDCGDLTDEQVEYLNKRLVTVDGVTVLNLPWRCQ